jgi:hypothetical protein
MNSFIGTLREADIKHRKQYEKFVIKDGNPIVSKLIDTWKVWNKDYFGNAFKVCPIILLSEPSKTSAYGSYSVMGAYGARSQIKIRPSLLSGTHPHMLAGPKYQEGRFLFIVDVLLHETIHLWQDEIVGCLEDAYHGHGPIFRDKCNEIGKKLGLPPVRTCKRRGSTKNLPSCSQFPHNVRPADYYEGAYVPTNSKPTSLRKKLENLLKEFGVNQIYTELQTLKVFYS